MQTNIATPTPHALPANSLVVPGSVKTLTHIALAGAVTFGLFVMMAKLIEQNAEVPVPTETPVLANIVLDVEETKTQVRPKIKPMPEPVKAPETKPTIPPQEPGPTNTNFNVDPVTVNTEVTINTTMGNGTQDMMARPIVRVDPSYPPDAARDGVEGWVKLAFDLTPQGSVANISILDAEPKRVFDREARRALAKWKYQPRVEKGVPMAQTGLQVILTFALEQ